MDKLDVIGITHKGVCDNCGGDIGWDVILPVIYIDDLKDEMGAEFSLYRTLVNPLCPHCKGIIIYIRHWKTLEVNKMTSNLFDKVENNGE